VRRLSQQRVRAFRWPTVVGAFRPLPDGRGQGRSRSAGPHRSFGELPCARAAEHTHKPCGSNDLTCKVPFECACMCTPDVRLVTWFEAGLDTPYTGESLLWPRIPICHQRRVLVGSRGSGLACSPWWPSTRRTQPLIVEEGQGAAEPGAFSPNPHPENTSAAAGRLIRRSSSRKSCDCSCCRKTSFGSSMPCVSSCKSEAERASRPATAAVN
jgi:hypothetical protein